MARATVKNSAPAPLASEQLVKAAVKEVEVTDARGRKILLRKPPFMHQFRLLKELPDELSQKSGWMMMVTPVFYVAAIDGDPLQLPMSEREIEATLQRLDDDGYQAAFAGMVEHFGQATDGSLDGVKK